MDYIKIETWLLFTIIIVTFSCRNYEDTISYPAPDRKNFIDITTELQLSNDPDPFWQHISLRSDSMDEPILPGNVYRVPFYEKPKVTWINSDTVIIKFSGNIGNSFKRNDLQAKALNGIKIIAIFENDKCRVGKGESHP